MFRNLVSFCLLLLRLQHYEDNERLLVLRLGKVSFISLRTSKKLYEENQLVIQPSLPVCCSRKKNNVSMISLALKKNMVNNNSTPKSFSLFFSCVRLLFLRLPDRRPAPAPSAARPGRSGRAGRCGGRRSTSGCGFVFVRHQRERERECVRWSVRVQDKEKVRVRVCLSEAWGL